MTRRTRVRYCRSLDMSYMRSLVQAYKLQHQRAGSSALPSVVGPQPGGVNAIAAGRKRRPWCWCGLSGLAIGRECKNAKAMAIIALGHLSCRVDEEDCATNKHTNKGSYAHTCPLADLRRSLISYKVASYLSYIEVFKQWFRLREYKAVCTQRYIMSPQLLILGLPRTGTQCM